MADRASADRVAADMNPPNYRAAIKRIRSSIVAKQTKIQSINGEISDDWAKVEGHKVNKKAGRIFLMLDKMDHEERTDIVRSLNGLIDASEWDKDATDLVDQAQGNVVQLHVHTKPGGEDDDGDDEQDTDGGEAEMREVEDALAQETEAKPRRSRKAANPDGAKAQSDVARQADAARAAAREKLGKGPPPEPYTGDNSDLAGE